MSKNKYLSFFRHNIRHNILVLLLVTSACAANGIQEKNKGSYVLYIDDFESRSSINKVGGTSGIWEKSQDDKNEWCSSKYVITVRDNKKTTVISLNYKVGSQDYNGYYSRLNGIDLRAYDSLEFYVRGGEKYPSTFKLELKNQFKETGQYYVKNIAGDKWMKLSIPLKDFNGINDFSVMEELTVVFEGSALGDSEGTLLIDDIAFKSPLDRYLETTKAIRNTTYRNIRELKDIVRLGEDEFLELISRKLFSYFLNEASAETGFIKDRSIPKVPSSIAATGFGLAAFCIADSRQWIAHEQAYDRVKKILTSVRDKAAKEHGFLYHFIDMDTGQRAWSSELSTIDTALLLAGVITVEEYFQEENIKNLCRSIYKEVDWKWMMGPRTKALYMGWTPESGFKDFALWDMFAEEMIMYILGMGASANSLPEESWHSFRRPVKKYGDYTYIYCDSESLFTYLYSHAFIDFRGRYDRYADYWRNSTLAIKSGIEFVKDNKGFYRTYREGFWGISASDGPDGYMNYGALKRFKAHDGTVAPYAVCGAMPFVPKKAIQTMRKLISKYGNKVWDDDYGFVSAFNLDRNWFSMEHIGIDVGISLLMIENYRSGFIWKHFMENENVKRGMEKAGFKQGTKKTVTGSVKGIVKGDIVSGQKKYRAGKISTLDELEKISYVKFNDPADIEYGAIENADDLSAEFAFAWDDEFLYLNVDVVDDTVIAGRDKKELYKDDCIELYLSPGSDILRWGNKKNFQIGFAPGSLEKKPVKYSFFQNEEPADAVSLKVKDKSGGYAIRVAIRWQYLNMRPEKGKYLGMSVAVHDVDKTGTSGKKFNWSFVNTPRGIILGRLILE